MQMKSEINRDKREGDLKTVKIIFLGNSITRHAPAPEIGWNGNWGMAASSAEKDYVHLAAADLRAAGKCVGYLARNIADLERNPGGAWEKTPEELVSFGADTLVLKVGENVPEGKEEAFQERIREVVKDLRGAGVRHVFLLGTFWAREAFEKGYAALAKEEGYVYISLVPLQDKAFQAVGEYAHEGVAAHPSDRGMRAIADLLLKAMREEGLLDAVGIPPFPEGEEEYRDIAVTLDGKKIPAYTARVSAIPFNCVWPGHQRPVEQTELAPFVRFDLAGEADVSVKAPFLPEEAVVRPLSRGVRPEITDKGISFTIPGPGQYTLELDGRAHALHIFADPPEKPLMDPESATYFFGPGVHQRERIVLKSRESVYLAPGAVLYSEIESTDAEDIAVFGRGILDGSRTERTKAGCDMRREGLVHFTRCRNIRMEGITLRDPCMWTVTAINCVGVSYDRVKLVGLWRYNADGFDFVNSQDVRVENCFLRTFDDAIVLKGLCLGEDRSVEKMNMERYLIRNNVVWCDWGGALEIGAETVADHYRDIVFENCDIIRTDQGALRVHSGDRADISNLLYRDIRVEYGKHDQPAQYQESDDMPYSPPEKIAHDGVIKIWMYAGRWSPDGIPGHVHGVRYERIRVFADPEVPEPAVMISGADEEHTAEDITIKDYTVNGKGRLRLEKGDFTGKITIL